MQGMPSTNKRPQVFNHKGTTGFTLIEILVTIVIISIVLGIALLKIDVDNFESRLKQEIGRLSRVMELADQQAIYQSQDIGLYLKDDGYGFYSQNEEKKWEPVDDSLLKKHEMPEDMEIIVSIEGADTSLLASSSKEKIPQIIFLSSGEWTIFEVVIAHRDEDDLSYLLTNAETGLLEIERVSNDSR